MRIDVLTLFPEMFGSPLAHSIIDRARQQGIVEIVLTNIRDFAGDNYHKVDDTPYGGGPGMVLMPGPVVDCFRHVEGLSAVSPKVIMLTPRGKLFDQQMARRLSTAERLVLVSGRYEGFDERIREKIGAEEVSIGDYVLSGGEIPAMVLIDSVVRLLPGAVGDRQSVRDESFSEGLLEYPQYTRPEVFEDVRVPGVLLSGNHAEIAKWRKQKSLEKTRSNRPDLLDTTDQQ